MNAVKQEEAVHGTRRDGSRRQGASVRKWRLCQRRCRALLMTALLNSLGMDPSFWWSKMVGKCTKMYTFSLHFFVV